MIGMSLEVDAKDEKLVGYLVVGVILVKNRKTGPPDG